MCLPYCFVVFCHMNVIDGGVSACGEEVDTCIYLV